MGKVTSTIAKINPFPQTDIFREPPLRFLGYANEIGEAFRNAMPNLLVPSYIVSFAYVFGDVFDKGRKQFLNDNHKITTALIVKTFDTLLWQSLASVILPGWVIHKVVDVSANAVHRVFPGKDMILGGLVSTKAIPVVLGLATIPFIVKPIDHAVEVGMDRTIRQTYKNICSLAVPVN